MGGINSLSGLGKVSVDYRPQIGPDAPNVEPQPQQGEDIIQINGIAQANAKSVVRQLDALLLNAASKSVSASAATKMAELDGKLHSNFLTVEESEELDKLAKDATDKLRALDNFSGRDLSKALMTKSGDLVWRKGFFGGMSGVTTAVKAAVEAQEALSEALAKLNDRIARDVDVDVETQEAFTELQFQCDRRATEIYSIVVRMHDLAQQDAANRLINADPQVEEYLDATFKELMPREAILMHGTAEALETMKAKFADAMRPLAEKLDAFAADATKTLSVQEVAELDAAMATMKNTLADVRKNGIEIRRPVKGQEDNIIKLVGEEDEAGDFTVSHTEVDKTILDEGSRLLPDAEIAKRLEALRGNINELRAAAKGDKRLFDTVMRALESFDGKALKPGLITKMCGLAKDVDVKALKNISANSSPVKIAEALCAFEKAAMRMVRETGVLAAMGRGIGGAELSAAYAFALSLVCLRLEEDALRAFQAGLNSQNGAKVSSACELLHMGEFPEGNTRPQNVRTVVSNIANSMGSHFASMRQSIDAAIAIALGRDFEGDIPGEAQIVPAEFASIYKVIEKHVLETHGDEINHVV